MSAHEHDWQEDGLCRDQACDASATALRAQFVTVRKALAARCDGCACDHPRLIRYGEDGHDYGGGFWQACFLRANERAALVKTEA